jgi:transcriptional regulator with XRE-family HTH domain
MGALIRARRRELGLSQTRLAVRGGVSKSTVSMLELGFADKQLEHVVRLLEAMDLELAVRPRRSGDP